MWHVVSDTAGIVPFCRSSDIRPANRSEMHRGETIENTGLVRRDAGAETTNVAEMRAEIAVQAPDLR
jgi:hypothetical protein